jgi:hypothetical protein
MPRIQSHIPSVNYKKMESIIEELINDGATRSEANISSIAAKLIDMGLILWEAQNKPKEEAQEGAEVSDGVDHFREILKHTMMAEAYSRMNLQIRMNPELLTKEVSYEGLKKSIEANVDSAIEGM